GIDRAGIGPEAAVADIQYAFAREELAVTGMSSRDYAVEHVDAARDGGDEIARRSDAHEVARPIRGQMRLEPLEDLEPLGLGFPDREPADRVAVEPDLAQPVEGRAPEVRVDAALHDAEQRGVAAVRAARVPPLQRVERLAASRRPAERELHRDFRVRPARGIRRALVENHHDVGIERTLHLDRALRRQHDLRAVDRRAELDTGLGHAAQLLEAEHLKAARIGEDWPLPVHETVQTAVRAHDLDARPKHQMKRVAE